MAQFPQAVRARVLKWRRQHPGWGAKTLWAELATDNIAPLPSRATIGRLLKQEGLSRRYQRHSALPARTRVKATRPHQCWQLDARGNDHVEGLGSVSLIDLSDAFSRARLLCYPCLLPGPSNHPTRDDYKTALRLAFAQWGLPETIQVDHESIFFDNQAASPYPTALHLWLEALGVKLVFSRFHRPTDQAVVERSHAVWYDQVIAGQCFQHWSALYEALLRRRDFLNGTLPSASHQARTILQAVPEVQATTVAVGKKAFWHKNGLFSYQIK